MARTSNRTLVLKFLLQENNVIQLIWNVYGKNVKPNTDFDAHMDRKQQLELIIEHFRR